MIFQNSKPPTQTTSPQQTDPMCFYQKKSHRLRTSAEASTLGFPSHLSGVALMLFGIEINYNILQSNILGSFWNRVQVCLLFSCLCFFFGFSFDPLSTLCDYVQILGVGNCYLLGVKSILEFEPLIFHGGAGHFSFCTVFCNSLVIDLFV